jgi:quercetin dioxygenase-like cupin family protein
VLCDDPCAIAGGALEVTAPNGTRIELAAWNPPISLPPLQASFVLTRLDARWNVGRAGMHYRDLIPDRQGGRYIASHIRIADDGPVPDYVHFHRVRFQMIYCYRGCARVVYEDQGPAFVMNPGDCVLQPPGIRHRVLESSGGLEAVEISSPARHETLADLEFELPTPAVRPDRVFGGQRFVRHVAAAASWTAWRDSGFVARDLGIAAATGGIATAHVVRRRGAASHKAELRFTFVLAGSATLRCDGQQAHRLGGGDVFVVPAGVRYAVAEASDELEFLEVTVPGAQP